MQTHHADVFNEKLRTLDAAAVGVILCRTREPHRAIEAIKAYAFSRDNMSFANWTPLFGWEKYDRANPLAAPQQDGEKSPVGALAKVGGIGDGGGDGFANGFYTMMLPHFWMDKNQAARIPMIFMLKEYVRMFSEGKRRLVLIAPLGTSLPPEISEEIVVLDFDAPSYAELRASLDYLIENSFGAKAPKIDEDGRAGIVAAGMGMSQQEFETAVSRAIVTYRQHLPNVPIAKVIEEVMKVKTEVVKRSEVLEVMPTTGMDQVGGLENLKEWVADRRSCFTEEARNFGIEAPKGVGLFGPPGTGQNGCQPSGSKVLMADGGWKRIEDVAIGDAVLSPQTDGSVLPVIVVHTRESTSAPIYKVSTTGRSGRKSYLCSNGHRLALWVMDRPGSSQKVRKRVTSAKDIPLCDFMARGKDWRSKAKVYTTPAYDLPEREFPVDPYTLGVILGDGCLTELDYRGGFDLDLGYSTGYSASIVSPYPLLNFLANIHGWGLPSLLPDRNSSRIYIPDGPVKEGLRELGLVRKNSHTKFIPDQYHHGSLQQRLALLAGLVDTDGTFEAFSSTNKELAEGFRKLVYSVGGTAQVRDKTTRYKGEPYKSYIVHYSTAEHIIPTFLEHKRRETRVMAWKNPRNSRFEVERVGEAAVFGFTLECGSQRYITDDFLVTSCLGCG